MVKKGTTKVPDAWEDDDWGVQADRIAPSPPPELQVPLTKKERLAQHAESNRKLWESAQESQAPMQFQSQAPPLAQPFQGPMRVLARKPAPQMIAKRDPVTGLESLALDDNSDDEKDSKPQETPEEMKARKQRELEKRQKRYEEARAKIFGTDNGSSSRAGSGRSSGNSTPGTVTPPRGGGNEGRRGRGGRGRGGFRGTDRGGSPARDLQRPTSRSGGRGNGGQEKELYDPNHSPKIGSSFEKTGSQSREDQQTIRAPRGPDGGGRGGFGFARRGIKEG